MDDAPGDQAQVLALDLAQSLGALLKPDRPA
jgi:hypothetical protein